MWKLQSWAHIYLPIIIGGTIYTLFRVDNLLVFQMYEILQIDGLIDSFREHSLVLEIPSFVKYSLPDGLWVYAFTYFLVSLWKYEENAGKEKYLIMIVPLWLGVGGEIMQIFFSQIGTFDFQDLLISLIAYIAGYIAVRRSNFKNEGDIHYG
ncbi:MAG TPA: hypothetical protein VNS08_16245 [Ureibacillus sp.]|nr:hypothetical protein [Ureibacillus sp.]